MTRVIPPIVAIDRNAVGDRLAFFADGRVARQLPKSAGGAWEPIDHIDYNALWPEPPATPVVADRAEVRYGTDAGGGWWQCSCPQPFGRRGFQGRNTEQCDTCGDQNPRLRPTPTP